MRRTYLKIYVVFFLLGIFTLSGCSAIGGGSPTPLPTVILGDLNLTPEGTGVGLEPVSGGTSASGVIAPKEDAQLVFTLAGKIAAMDVAVGQRVEARQTLAQLEGQEELQAAISAAEYMVEQARQALSDLQEESEGKRVQAMQDVITYERAVRDAQYALDNFTVPSNQASLDTVEAISIMKQRMDEARARFEPFKYRPSTDPIRKDRLEVLNEAQADYNAAVKRLQYEYNLDVAETQLTQAQSDYATFKAGPDPDQNHLAEARLSDAETQLSAAQAALKDLNLTAPFAGTISKINSRPGEWVIPGQVILVLADLDHLQVKTTDLSERDIPRVRIGQAVTVFIEALGETVTGKVVDIAPLADVLGGDVVYQTSIALDSIPEGLRAGMSVEVQFGEE